MLFLLPSGLCSNQLSPGTESMVNSSTITPSLISFFVRKFAEGDPKSRVDDFVKPRVAKDDVEPLVRELLRCGKFNF